MTGRLLVTGFGPFPTVRRNPSAALAVAVAESSRWRALGVSAESLILTTAYAALPGELDPALASGPDAVLMIGVARRSKAVRVEQRATARRSTLFADATGEAASRASGGGEVRWTRLRPTEAVTALRRRGVTARRSRNAGRYLCNAAYFRALALGAPVVFIHIPMPPQGAKRGPRDPRRLDARGRLEAALVDVAILVLRDARRFAAGRSRG